MKKDHGMTAPPLRNPSFSEVVITLVRFTFLCKPSLNRILALLLALYFLLMWWPISLSAGDAPPLPEDLKIEAPGPEVPPEISDFLGVWEGQWKINSMNRRIIVPVTLAVEKVYPRKAMVVFSLGKDPAKTFPQAWRRLEGTFSGRQELLVPLARLDITFFFNDKGNLEGKVSSRDHIGRCTMDYIELRRKGDVSVIGNLSSTASLKKGPARQDKEHKLKGKTLSQQGEYAQALSEMDQALALNPKDAETFTRRGGIYTLQKQYDKAINDFNQALELDPRYAKAYYNRALAYYYQGKYDQALSDLQKNIELKPKDAEAYHNRGLVYTQKNDYGKAIDDFNMAVALNPKLADAYFNKAATCERAGRQNEAREAYAAYLKVAPPEARAQIEQARSRLR
jgi:tetratricopeptide (TPR) repeat protein